MRIYVAGPYTQGDVAVNVAKALDAGLRDTLTMLEGAIEYHGKPATAWEGVADRARALLAAAAPQEGKS